METDRDKLRQTLDRLQAQVDAMRSTHPYVASHLDPTLAEAQSLLAGEGSDRPSESRLVARLRDAVLKYEASHPNLAINLGSLIDALGKMGI